ncbi:MAG TPA: hypothetical protein VHB01_10410 [Nitrosospira sp.]|nr:hypothetical protein [Nitrosospira sp.]
MATALGKNRQDILIALFTLVLLAAGIFSSPAKADSLSDRPASQAASQNEHDVLAQKFEVAAQGMQQKAEEQKKLLEQYEQIQFYGWQSHNLKSRTIALIRKYEEAARSNMKEAAAHRQMAQPNPTYATPGVQIPQTGSN